MMILQITTKLPITSLPTHQTSSQSSSIILILEYIIQFFKKNPIINFIFPLELWFFGKVLKSAKIALVVVPADPYQIAHHQPSNPPNYLPIIINNSNIGIYYLVFQEESDYQLYFSIGVMILWQSAKKHQNCVGGDPYRSLPNYPLSTFQPTNTP